MSRGLGRMERLVLRDVQALAAGGEPTTRSRVVFTLLGPALFASVSALRPTMTSFHCAVRSLQKKGLLREAPWTNALEVTASGDQALRDLKGGPQREILDRKTVRRQAEARLEQRGPVRREAAPDAPGRPAPRAGRSSPIRTGAPVASPGILREENNGDRSSPSPTASATAR